MGRRTESKAVICPYYKSHLGNVIVCEGIDEVSSIHMCFADSLGRNRHMDTACASWQYASRCRIASAHELFWAVRH